MAQQLINLGAAPDDGTGSKWRAGGDIINDNFTEVYGNPLDNVININSLADLTAISAPDGGGFIEIGGGAAAYEFNGDMIDISPYTVRVTGGAVVLRGANRFASGLLSTSANPLITITNAFYADEFMSMDNVNGDIYNVTNTGLANSAFVTQNGIVRGCKSIGTVRDTNTVSLRIHTVGTTSVGGWLLEGTDLGALNISNGLGVSWSGTLLDLGTSTWDIIDFATGSKALSPPGTTILSGLPNSGNLTANGVGLVEGNIFNGSGTSLVGILTTDLKWEFSGNRFVDGSTQNTRTDADAYLSALQSVPNAGSGVYTPIAGSNWLSDISNRWTIDTAGMATYIGLEPLDFPMSITCTVEKGGGGAGLICIRIAKDTGSGFTTIAKSQGCTENSTPTQISAASIIPMETGDKIQAFVAIDDGVSTIEISTAIALISVGS